MSLEAIREFLADDLRAVDRVIRERLHSDVALVRQVSQYIIGSGGKRLRPLLVLLSARACGYQGSAQHELAAVVEFIHTATLLHDDVVDESSLRRGSATANALFGNSASVLVGDFLYSRAFQMMVGVQSMPVLRVLADATNTVAEGEVMQLMNCHDPDIDEGRYLQVIRYKTAKLFEAASRLGAILGAAPEASQSALAEYGGRLGTAFQLIDDVLDYSGEREQTGKNLGDDLAEGKPTLPLIYALRNGSAEQVQAIRQAIEAGGLDKLEMVLKTIEESGALDYSNRRAREEADAACAALGPIPHSMAKDCLLELADFAVRRSF
jgi:octaprenyl-diphosphate synthase